MHQPDDSLMKPAIIGRETIAECLNSHRAWLYDTLRAYSTTTATFFAQMSCRVSLNAWDI